MDESSKAIAQTAGIRVRKTVKTARIRSSESRVLAPSGSAWVVWFPELSWSLPISPAASENVSLSVVC